MIGLRDWFKTELAFSRYLQGSSTFRTVVEHELGFKLAKTSAKTLKEVRLYKRPHRLNFPTVSNGLLVDYRTADGNVAWRPSEEQVDFLDPVVRAANKDFLRADLILYAQDLPIAILVENQFGLSDRDHRDRLMEYYFTTRYPLSPEREDWDWVFWVAEDFREQDIQWVREHGHPVAMFKAWPKGNSVRFELVYAPVRIDEASNLSIQPIKQRPLQDW